MTATTRATTAVVVLDVITELEFPDGAALRAPALRAAERIRPLLERARRNGVLVVYANDSAGAWRPDANELLARCSRPESKGRALVELLRPRPSDQFLLEPKHSAFFATALDVVLARAHVRKLVLVGFSAHQCVLFTATDAHVRELELVVPRDCVAAPRPGETRFALRYFRDVLGASTPLSARVRFSSRGARGAPGAAPRPARTRRTRARGSPR